MKSLRIYAVVLTCWIPAAALADTSTLIKNSLSDGGYLFTSPLRLTADDVPMGLAVAAVLGGSLALDRTDRRGVLPHVDSGLANTWRSYGDVAQFMGPIMGGGFAVSGWALHDDYEKHASWDLFESFIWANAIAYTFKFALGRRRPDATDDPFELRAGKYSGAGFPSAHTISAFSGATMVAEYYPSWQVAVPAYAAATAVAFSRVYSNQHWTSDVVGGALMGYGVSHFLFKRRQKRFESTWDFNIGANGIALSKKF